MILANILLFLLSILLIVLLFSLQINSKSITSKE